MTDILCPTCKDDDCIDSYRVDSCTACGWSQYVPLESDRFQAKKECECICQHNEFCNVEHKCHKPSPAPERDNCKCNPVCPGKCIKPEREVCWEKQCAGSTHYGTLPHDKPSDAVEAKIMEIVNETTGATLLTHLERNLRELVKIVRQGA